MRRAFGGYVDLTERLTDEARLLAGPPLEFCAFFVCCIGPPLVVIGFIVGLVDLLL